MYSSLNPSRRSLFGTTPALSRCTCPVRFSASHLSLTGPAAPSDGHISLWSLSGCSGHLRRRSAERLEPRIMCLRVLHSEVMRSDFSLIISNRTVCQLLLAGQQMILLLALLVCIFTFSRCCPAGTLCVFGVRAFDGSVRPSNACAVFKRSVVGELWS